MIAISLLLLIFAFISFYKPTVAVGLILALAPTYLVRFEISKIPVTFLELLILVFVLVTLIINIKKITSLKSLGQINYLILAFIIAGIASIFVSPDKASALGIFKAFIIEPILFFYACRLSILEQKDLKLPLRLLFLSCVVISILGIIQYFTFMYLPLRFWGTGEEVLRITSVFEYPNALALYLAPLIAFFVSVFWSNQELFGKKTAIMGILVMIVALIMTFSRGAWIGLFAGIVFLLFVKLGKLKVLGIAGVVLAILLSLPMTRDRLLLTARDPSSFAHVELMNAAINKIGSNPIFGNGLFGFRHTLTEQNFSGEILNYPHNIFLSFWLEMGILGLMTFIGLLVLAFKQYKTKPSSAIALGAIAYLIVFLVHGLVDVPYFKNDLSLLFWFILSMLFI